MRSAINQNPIPGHSVKSYGIGPLELALWGGSALTDSSIPIPKSGVDTTHIPVTYVPARNTILLSLALSWAEVINASAIYIGVNSLDYSGYPDCHPEFIATFQEIFCVATKATTLGSSIPIVTPLQHKTKVEIVRRAFELNVPLERTWSCYGEGEEPCGVCDSCRLRIEAIRPVEQERSAT